MPKQTNKYFSLDFYNLTEKGLKKLIESFKKSGQNLVDFSGSNRAIRKDGQKIKLAKLFFDSGQSVSISVNETGDLTQVKLNSTVLPITKLNRIADFTKEVSSKIKANQDRFEKSLARKAEKAINQQSNTKPVNRNVSTRVKEAQSELDAAQTSMDHLKNNKTKLIQKISKSTSDVSQNKSRLEAAKSKSSDLIDKILEFGVELNA